MIAPDLRRDEGRWDAKGKEVWEPHSKIHLSVKYGVFYEKKKKIQAAVLFSSLSSASEDHTLSFPCLSSISTSLRVLGSKEEQGLVLWLGVGPL